MRYLYYWTDEIPASPNSNQEPAAFFESLLSAQDRFSIIVDDYRELESALQGVTKEAGYELVLYRESAGSDNVIGQIMYTKPNSPATTAGLKRGDVITHINGQLLTANTFGALLGQINETHTVTYRPFDVVNRTLGTTPVTLSLTTIEYAENPVYFSQVYDFPAASKKVGYLMYNLFSAGTISGSTVYNDQMDAFFAGFKSQGITDLVLDLRYNSGGAISAAVNLASLMVCNVTANTVFVQRQYNQQVIRDIVSDAQLGPSFLVDRFVEKTQSVGSQLTRVYILTGSRTASASELVINGLKPFMEVFIIGQTTVGKNVGSILVNEDDNPANTWGMLPIVLKLFNSQGQSDYDNGFAPDIKDLDNSLAVYPLGDVRESMLNKALVHITGGPVGGRVGAAERFDREVIATSFDRKVYRNRLIIDPL
jgi:carboxyl-terminal processing protease